MISCRNRHNKKAWQAPFFLTMALASSPSVGSPVATVGLSGGLEAFHLKEIDSSGVRLLSETGNRYVTTAFLDNGDKYQPETPLIYHLEASAYWGQVDYDGKSQSIDATQSNLPLMSQTDYRGGRAEALVGYGFSPFTNPRAIEVLGGLGVDSWNRSIHNATTANGTLVSGIEETYTAYYGKVALGLRDLISVSWHSHLQFGIKMPFSISEDINLSQVGYDNDLTISPGNRYSGFVSLLLEPQAEDKKPGNLVINVYYDGFRFDPSKPKTATRNGSSDQVWQPETHIDVFGLQIGYRF